MTSDEDKSTVFLNLGEMLSKLDSIKEAKAFFGKVLEYNIDRSHISSVYNNIGYYHHAGSVKKEIEYHKKAIHNYPVLGELLAAPSSSLKILKDFPEKRLLLSWLIDLSQALIKLYEEDPDTKHLQEALNTIYAIDNLISIMRLDSSTKSSKLFWIKRGVNTYLSAVKI